MSAICNRSCLNTNLVALQQAIGRLLENELQKLVLARGNEEFAFRVIDTAVAPRKKPRKKSVSKKSPYRRGRSHGRRLSRDPLDSYRSICGFERICCLMRSR